QTARRPPLWRGGRLFRRTPGTRRKTPTTPEKRQGPRSPCSTSCQSAGGKGCHGFYPLVFYSCVSCSSFVVALLRVLTAGRFLPPLPPCGRPRNGLSCAPAGRPRTGRGRAGT